MPRPFLIVLLTASFCLSCAGYLNIYQRPPTIDLFFDRVILDYAIRNPELLTMAGILESYGLSGHNRLLTDVSDEFRRKMLRAARRDLRTLRSYDLEELGETSRLSASIMEWYLRDQVEAEEFILLNYPFNHHSSVYQELPQFMVSIHPVKNLRDAKHYIDRLYRFPEKIEPLLSGINIREARGIVPPTFILHKVITEMKQFISVPPEENLLVNRFREKLEGIRKMRRRTRLELVKTAGEVVGGVIYPLYSRVIARLVEQLGISTEDAGVWKFPDGERYYTFLVRHYTSTDLTPAEVHETGLEEVARIRLEIRELLPGLGIDSAAPVQEVMRRFNEMPGQRFSEDPKDRKEIIAEVEEIVRKAKKDSEEAFGFKVRKNLKVIPLPEYRANGGPVAFYEPGAFTGLRPAFFHLNLSDLSLLPRYSVPTLVYHETYPGHHLQAAVQMEQQEVPFFRRALPVQAFVEGWALYAEKLAHEFGWISDPAVNIGRLHAELVRAARLVVDSGIHAGRWSRERAITYMKENSGLTESAIETEVDRYIVQPGQACAYTMGLRRILDLREKARRALGPAFDLREFHRAVLENGAVPLHILDEIVDGFIAGKMTTPD